MRERRNKVLRFGNLGIDKREYYDSVACRTKTNKLSA